MAAVSSLPARAIGIDFGTSNSTAGWLRPDLPALLALEDDKATLPSVVFFNAEEDSVSYGRAALAEYLDGYEGRLMRSLKSLLGTSLLDGQTEVQGRALPYRQLLAQFIGELKQRAETSAGHRFEQVVLGRPVHFIDDDAAADQQAEDTLAAIARAAGFVDIAFQYEPIAAAFAYEADIEREERVLIADIGGGTSDFSLLRLSPAGRSKADRRSDILANEGVHIGGTDFDRVLSLAGVMPLLGLHSTLRNGSAVPSGIYFNLATWHTINQAYSRKAWSTVQEVYRDADRRDLLDRLCSLIGERAGHWLAMEVEAGKIALSAQDSHRIALDRLDRNLHCDLSRALFDQACAPLVAQIENAVQATLASAGVSAASVDTLFLTGGGSGVPLLRQRIAACLPQARVVEGDRFGSIGTGLAIEAQRLFG